MKGPTIEMERDAVVAKLEQYEEAARTNPRAFRDIDKGLIEGYRLLAKGRRLVDVNDALKHGGLNLAGIPKLAISRAHRQHTAWHPGGKLDKHFNKEVWSLRGSGDVNSGKSGGGVYCYGVRSSSWASEYRIVDNRSMWIAPDGTFDGSRMQGGKTFTAMTPLVPLPLRPRHKLENYFLLWEANWHPAPPVDPYLLRPIAGSLMEIIAEWELTPLEIAAVRGANAAAD